MAFLAAGYSGCAVDAETETELGDEQDIDTEQKLSIDSSSKLATNIGVNDKLLPIEGQVEQSNHAIATLGSVIQVASGTFYKNHTGFGSKTYMVTVGTTNGACPTGSTRYAASAFKSDGTSGASCKFEMWYSQASDSCQAVVRATMGAGGRIWCSWNIDGFNNSTQDGAYSYEGSNTLNALQYTTNYPLSLSEGSKLTVGTCGLPYASATGDTYLRLVGPDGYTTVAANDDNCSGSGSQLIYMVPSGAGGDYMIRAGCYGSSSCSGAVRWFVE
jgi:hypothetical protein